MWDYSPMRFDFKVILFMFYMQPSYTSKFLKISI